MKVQNPKKKLNILLVAVVLLVTGLAITSFALTGSIVTLYDQSFAMSEGIELEINHGNPVFEGGGVLYEPGGRYLSEFPITNPGTLDVWYRIYITDVEGGHGEDITVTIKEQDGTVLCHGKMNELNANRAATSSLAAKEEKILSIEFCFSSDAENRAQGQTISFSITADATQKKNNPMGLFE